MTTVLFIHGLESGPQGHKARQLAAAGFEVVSAQMPCNPRERWKDPAVLGVLATPIVLVNAAAPTLFSLIVDRWGWSVAEIVLLACASSACVGIELMNAWYRRQARGQAA